MSETLQATGSGDSAGGTLRRLRDENGLTVQEVAAQLHLEPRIIDALEEDDLEKLPAALYVRGYIRSYAKLLKVDAEPIIALYNNCGTAELPEIIPEVRRTSQRSSADKPVKAFTYFVSLTLVLLLVAWWQSNFTVGGGDAPATPKPEPEPAAPVSQLDYTYPVVEHPKDPLYRAPAPEPEPGTTTTVELTADNELKQYETQLVTTEGEGPDSITLRLSADSWIEVFDRNDEKVYVNLAREGETLELHGTAPFSVTLGFAQGVSVEYNGRPFDPAPYSRSGVARFTLEN